MALINTSRKDKNIISQQGELIKMQEGIIKTIGLKTKDFIKIFDTKKNNERLQSSYKQLPAVYACIRAKAKNLAQVPFNIYKGDSQVTAGAIVELFETINPFLNKYQFIEALVTALDLDGNAYIELDETFEKGMPVYLWARNPRHMEPAYTRDGAWVGWYYKPDGNESKKRFIQPERMIHFNYYNPDSELRGLSPLQVLQQTNQTLWAAGTYNHNFFENDATPPFVYTTPQKPSDRLIQELKSKLIDKRRGLKKAHEPDILFGDMDVKTIGMSQKDVQFLQLMKFTREDICMVYGVPKKIISIYEDINYATAEIAEQQFWEDTIVPIARLLEAGINQELLSPMGLTGAFDFSGIDAMNKRVAQQTDTVVKLLGTGQFTRNELNQKFRLGFEDVKWGDEPVSFGFGTIQESAGAPEVKSAPPIPVKREEPKMINVDEALLAQKWVDDMVPLIPTMSKAAKSVSRYFYEVEQTIVKSLTKKVDGVMYSKARSLDELPEGEIEKAFSDEELYLALKPYLESSVEKGWSSILQTGFRMDNSAAQAILADKRIKVIEINKNAKSEIIENLRAVIKEGLANGVPQDQLAQSIIEGMTGQMKNIKKRAKTIARTEVNNSFAQSKWAAVEQDPPDKIRWISSQDSKVRDSHQYLNNTAVEYGKKFSNGLLYPHDPNGSAGEVINCRCTYEPIWGEDE